jgi:hypothetical protein
VVVVGRAPAAAESGEQQDLVEGVGSRVGGLGQHGGRPGQKSADQLGDRDAEIGRQGQQHRGGGGIARLFAWGLSRRRTSSR